MAVKPYPKDPRFAVSEDGSVVGPRGRKTYGTKWNTGRMCVTTSMNGKKISYSVSRMVLETFVGPCPLGNTASHLNGICDDNRLSNLIWESHSKNCLRKLQHGTHQGGEHNPAAKLTCEEVEAIRASKLSSRSIAGHYGVSDSHIRRIRQGKTWPLNQKQHTRIN